LGYALTGAGEGEIGMATGTLKMWNADRGFGFITDDAAGPDMFLHVTLKAKK
jgi:CspA family cold shock protein